MTEVGLGTADVTLTGSQSAIDTALAAGLTYTPTLDYHYADVLAVSVDDEGHNVSHVAQTTTQDVGIIITPADTVAANATFTVVGRIIRHDRVRGHQWHYRLRRSLRFHRTYCRYFWKRRCNRSWRLHHARHCDYRKWQLQSVTDTTLLTVYQFIQQRVGYD